MPANIGNKTYYPNPSSTSTHTISTTIGSATGRKIVLGILADSTSSVTGATFDGATMTQEIAHTNASASGLKIWVYYYDVPDVKGAGTYNTVFTTAAASTRFSAYVFELTTAATGASAANNIAQGGSGTTFSPSLTASAGAALILLGNNNSPTQTWTLSGDVADEQEGNETEYTSLAGDASNVSAGTRTATGTASDNLDAKSVILLAYNEAGGGGGGATPRRRTFLRAPKNQQRAFKAQSRFLFGATRLAAPPLPADYYTPRNPTVTRRPSLSVTVSARPTLNPTVTRTY